MTPPCNTLPSLDIASMRQCELIDKYANNRSILQNGCWNRPPAPPPSWRLSESSVRKWFTLGREAQQEEKVKWSSKSRSEKDKIRKQIPGYMEKLQRENEKRDKATSQEEQSAKREEHLKKERERSKANYLKRKQECLEDALKKKGEAKRRSLESERKRWEGEQEQKYLKEAIGGIHVWLGFHTTKLGRGTINVQRAISMVNAKFSVRRARDMSHIGTAKDLFDADVISVDKCTGAGPKLECHSHRHLDVDWNDTQAFMAKLDISLAKINKTKKMKDSEPLLISSASVDYNWFAQGYNWEKKPGRGSLFKSIVESHSRIVPNVGRWYLPFNDYILQGIIIYRGELSKKYDIKYIHRDDIEGMNRNLLYRSTEAIRPDIRSVYFQTAPRQEELYCKVKTAIFTKHPQIDFKGSLPPEVYNKISEYRFVELLWKEDTCEAPQQIV